MRLYRPIESYSRISDPFRGAGHRGLDLVAPVGTKVFAPVSGKAFIRTDTAENGGFGKYARIETATDKVYCSHLDSWAVADGAQVMRGDLIGYSGSTGNSTGPHLHLEIRRLAGSPYLYGAVDPWPLIEWSDKRSVRPVGVHLGNDCPLRDRDKEIIRTLRPGAVTFLPNYPVNSQPIRPKDIEWIRSIVPDVHIILRPYVPPPMLSAYGTFRDYVTAVISSLPAWVALVPEGRLHLQLFNEQNMPLWAGWEGFGDQLADMQWFDLAFCEAYERIKGAAPSILVGWTPLTIGHRDCWFAGDDAGHYYLHGPGGCVEPDTLTAAQWKAAREASPCYKSLSLADEHYYHIYCHHGSNDWHNAAYGLRFERYRYWWPEKDGWITEYGMPNKTYRKMPGAEDALVNESTYLMESAPNVHSACLWILGDNARWGGEMYAPDDQVIYRLGEINRLAEIDEPEAPEEPQKWLPSTDQLTLEAMASNDPYKIWVKIRWWQERATRLLEDNNLPDSLDILHDMVTPVTGISYVLEKIMAGTQWLSG